MTFVETWKSISLKYLPTFLYCRSGASTGTQWKPQVQAVGEMPAKPTQQGQTFTKTSLAAEKVVSNFEH